MSDCYDPADSGSEYGYDDGSDSAVIDAPTDGAVYLDDSSGDGVADTITQMNPDGTAVVVEDTDGDLHADLLALDLNADGLVDVAVQADGASDDHYVVSADANADGTIDSDESTTISAAQLEELLPGATDALSIDFDPGAVVAPDPTDPPVQHDPAIDSTESTPDEDWRTQLADDPSLQPNEFGQIGDADGWREHWFEQAENGYCAPASVAQIVSEYTGHDFTDESAFVQLAQENGLLGPGADAVNGMLPDDISKLLTLCGIPAETEQGDIGGLADAINDGRGVMVAIDSGEYWDPGDEPAGDDNTADHCVVVTEIDEARGVVYLSDPGHPQGNELQMPIEQFENAWADSANTMIVCDQPAPAGGAHDTTGGSRPGADSGDPSGQSDAVQQAVNQAAHDATTQDDDVLSNTIGWLTANPWILLPVVLPAGALIARTLKREPSPPAPN
jgi:hypothetical protein